MAEKKEVKEKKIVKPSEHNFKCLHCGLSFMALADNGLGPINCSECGSSVTVRLE